MHTWVYCDITNLKNWRGASDVQRLLVTLQGYFEFVINLFIFPFVRWLGYMWDNDVFISIHFAETLLMCRQYYNISWTWLTNIPMLQDL